MTTLEEKRKILEQKREANRAAAEAAKSAAEEKALDDAIAAEGALEQARMKHGHDRAIHVEIKGAGCVVVHWPDKAIWWHFENRGILKKDGMTAALCEELVCRVLDYPTVDRYKEMTHRNPDTSVQVANLLVSAMQTKKRDEEGNE